MTYPLLRCTPVTLVFGALAFGTAASGQELDCRQTEMIVPHGAGGGTDLFARYLATFFSESLPGQPTIIVTNVPGGNSVAGANQFQERSEPDGCTLMVSSSSVGMNFLLGDELVRYDLASMVTVMASPGGTLVYAHSSTGITNPDGIAALKGKSWCSGRTARRAGTFGYA